MKGATLFTGFDGVGIGMRAAGIDVRWGIEIDPRIASVANRNFGGRVFVQDILTANPADFERVDVLHASPECTRASRANTTAQKNGDGLKETPLDVSFAEKIVEFVRILKPVIFTLENVWEYRNFQSFIGGKKCRGILPSLIQLGYSVRYWHLNSANYGVAQTRKRLMLVASLGFVPCRPPITHQNPDKLNGQGHLFGHLPSWVGWFEAIEDLIPTLPESQFAPWQLARLPEDIKTYLIGNDRNGDARDRLNVSPGDDPAFTVTSSNGSKLRAFLLAASKSPNGKQIVIRKEDEPANTVVSSGDKLITRAFIMSGSVNTNFEEAEPGAGIRLENEPMHVISSGRGGRIPKAFILGNGSRSNPIPLDEPTQTITADSNQTGVKAFLMDGQNACPSNGLPTLRSNEEPSFSITDQSKGHSRAWLSSGRVVSMTPRALARFQSFPDWYELPEKNGPACKGLGNAVPPLFYQRVIEAQIRKTP